MACMAIWKRGISLLLVLALLLVPGLQVSAEEVPEGPPVQAVFTEPVETEAVQETEAVHETEAPEETEALQETETVHETEIPEETEAPQETEAVQEAEEPAETETPEVTEAAGEGAILEEIEEAAVWSKPPGVTIADVLEMPAGEDAVLLEGTVVYAGKMQAVLQDATGGIRLAFTSSPDIALGECLLVTGRRTNSGFAVTEFEKTGTGDLPAVNAALAEGRDALRLQVQGAVLGKGSLTQNGYTCLLVATVPEGLAVGDRVDVWGVMLDGEFFADTILPSENQEPESTPEGSWNFYFGQLHAHTDISDGIGSVEEAFSYAKQTAGLDFFAVTDHSNSFDNGEKGSIDTDGTALSREWAAGKAAAAGVTDETFVGLFGYEMTWPEELAIGHINTFGTPGWQTRDQEGMYTLQGYLDALEAEPDSVSQFNHPGAVYGDFGCFADYTPQYDARMHLLEVGGEGFFAGYDAYTAALDAGWHLAPSNNQNNHNGNWGNASGARTVVLAEELTEEAIYDAARHYRVYATQDADLKILYHLNGRIMGSVMGEAEALEADIRLEDGSGDGIGRVEIVTDGGNVAAFAQIPQAAGECSLEIPAGGSYYYLRVLRDQETVAVTAPVWVDSYEDLGIEDFTADAEKPEQGTPVELMLTLYNHENLPFVVESVTFSAGARIMERIDAPGSAAPLGELAVPLTYTQDAPGAVTVTATVTGTIGGLSRSYQTTVTLHYQARKARMLSVEKVRTGMLGEAYRIRGYVTAGTSNPYNTFQESIYLQDDSGGIQIMDFTAEGIQLGTPMEIEGILRSAGGNLVLAMTDYEIPAEDSFRYVPRTMTHQVAMDYEAHGGELLQIEGHVVSMTNTADKLGVSRFTIRDIVGDLATVIVEDGIGSGAYGTNELLSEVKTGRTVRAMGLLHIDEYGKTVLRVRNCDEVAYVPPKRDPSNPKTGDWLCFLRTGK